MCSHFKLGIKTQLILLVIVIGIIFSAAAYKYYTYDHQTTRTEIFNSLHTIANLKAEQLTQWHKERKSEAIFFTTTSPHTEIASQIANGNNQNAKHYRESLLQIMTDKRYQNIFMLSENNRIIFSVYPENKIEIDSITLRFSESVFSEHKILFTDFYYCKEHKTIHFDIIAPIFDSTKKVIATLVFRVKPEDYLYPLLQRLPIESKTAETIIVKKEGDSVIYLNNLRHISNLTLTIKTSINKPHNSAVLAVNGFEGFAEFIDYRGIRVLADIRAVEGTSWHILSKIDKNEAYAELKTRTILITIFVLLITLFLGTITALIYHYRQRNIYKELYLNKNLLYESQEALKAIFYSIGDGVITTDLSGKIERINAVAEKLTGWSETEARGKHIDVVFNIINEETRQKAHNPINRVLEEGIISRLADHTLLIARDGHTIPIADSAAPIKDKDDNIQGVVMVFNNQTEKRHNQKLLEFRVKLIEYSANHNEKDILNMAINQICKIMNSPLGYIQYVDEAKGSSKIVARSSQTKIKTNVEQPNNLNTSSWSTCIEKEKTIIYNDKPPKNSNFPRENPELIREMVVPVFRKKKIVAIVGIGNKPTNYTMSDSESLTFLSDITWTITEGKNKETQLIESEERYRLILDNSLDAILLTDTNGKIISANNGACNMFGMTEPEICQIGRKGIIDTNDSKFNELLEKIENQGLAQGEMNFIRKNGEIFPAEITSAVFYNSSGEKHTSLIVRDITQRVEAEKKIRDERLLLRTLIDNLPDAIYVKNIKGQKILSNLSDLKMMGKNDEQDIIGMTDIQIYGAEHGQKGYHEDLDVLEKNKLIFNKEVYTPDLDEKKKWHLISKFPLRDESGKIKGLVGYTRDVTERKYNEKIQNILYQIAIASMSVKNIGELLIIVHEQLSRVINTENLYVARYIPNKEILEKVFFVNEKHTINEWSIHDTLSGMVIKEGKSIILSQKEIEQLAVEYKKRPEYIPAKSWIGIPLKSNKRIMGVMVLQNYNKPNIFKKHHAQLLEMVAHELVIVLQRAQMIEDLITAKEKAEENDRLKSAFLANISHEIRTPMNGILGFMELLSERNINTTQREKYLDIMNKNGQRLIDTINDIIEISKLESGQIEVNISDTNTAEILNDHLIFFKQQAERKSLKLHLSEFIQGSEAIIPTDKFKLEAILTNLLNNAIKYTNEGNIEFGSSIEDKQITFFVKDTGIGIPPNKINSIFERFIQDEQYISRPQEGVGLGLSIVKGYIDMLNGDIWVNSEVGKGSTFYFSLPIKQ